MLDIEYIILQRLDRLVTLARGQHVLVSRAEVWTEDVCRHGGDVEVVVKEGRGCYKLKYKAINYFRRLRVSEKFRK